MRLWGNRHSHPLLGMQTGTTPVEGNLPISTQLCMHYSLIEKSHLGIQTKDTLPTIQKYICTKLFIVALFLITKFGKLPTRPSTEDWLNNLQQHIYTLKN